MTYARTPEKIGATLDGLKAAGYIRGWEPPHPNAGRGDLFLPWVIHAGPEGSTAKMFKTDAEVSDWILDAQQEALQLERGRREW